MNHVPYKGSAEAVQGLLTGSVDFIVDGMAASLPLIQSGKLRALAKLNNRHLTALPEVQPLSVAAGLPQIPECRAGSDLSRQWERHLQSSTRFSARSPRMYADPAVAGQLGRSGINPVTSTPAEFDKFFRDEATHWTKVCKDSGVKFD